MLRPIVETHRVSVYADRCPVRLRPRSVLINDPLLGFARRGSIAARPTSESPIHREDCPMPRTKSDSASRSDNALRWLIGVLALGVLINLLSDQVKVAPMTWSLSGLLAVAVIATSPAGFLRRNRAGGTRGALIGAVLALFAYVALSIHISNTEADVIAQLTQVVCLWLSATLLSWQTFRAGAALHLCALGVAGILVGVATFLYAGKGLSDANFPYLSWNTAPSPELLLAVGYLLVGAGPISFGIGCLLQGTTAMATGTLLTGLGVLLVAVSMFMWGHVFIAAGVLLASIGTLLLVAAYRLKTAVTMVVALVMLSASFVLMGVELSLSEEGLIGAGLVLGGLGLSLLVISLAVEKPENRYAWAEHLLFGTGNLLLGAMALVLGVDLFLRGQVLLGVGALLASLAMMLAGVACLLEKRNPVRAAAASVFRYLARRTD